MTNETEIRQALTEAEAKVERLTGDVRAAEGARDLHRVYP